VAHIVGIGVDVEQVDRFRTLPPGLFTEAEVAYCTARADPAEALAGTWCAKEAAVKSLSSYLTVLPRDIEVTRDPAGAPKAALRDSRRGLQELPQLHVSISHAGGIAIAVAAAVLPGEALPGEVS